MAGNHTYFLLKPDKSFVFPDTAVYIIRRAPGNERIIFTIVCVHLEQSHKQTHSQAVDIFFMIALYLCMLIEYFSLKRKQSSKNIGVQLWNNTQRKLCKQNEKTQAALYFPLPLL